MGLITNNGGHGHPHSSHKDRHGHPPLRPSWDYSGSAYDAGNHDDHGHEHEISHQSDHDCGHGHRHDRDCVGSPLLIECA